MLCQSSHSQSSSFRNRRHCRHLPNSLLRHHHRHCLCVVVVVQPTGGDGFVLAGPCTQMFLPLCQLVVSVVNSLFYRPIRRYLRDIVLIFAQAPSSSSLMHRHHRVSFSSARHRHPNSSSRHSRCRRFGIVVIVAQASSLSSLRHRRQHRLGIVFIFPCPASL